MKIAGNAIIATITNSCCFMDRRDKGMFNDPSEKITEFGDFFSLFYEWSEYISDGPR
jgi:hypothetical protein